MPELEDMPLGMPIHLGGGERRCHEDEGALRYMIDTYNIKSMLDIGCGRGCQVKIGNNLNLKPCWGVDGDKWMSGKFWKDITVIVHDYTIGQSSIKNSFDLIWSVEFLEHVEEQYMPSYMKDFQLGKYVVCTFALPGKGGHWHVNLQEKEYWINKFKNYGFNYSEKDTEAIKTFSTMKKTFIKHNGMVFVKQ